MPPNGPAMSIGTTRAAEVTPAQTADPVRWYTSVISATL
jgi:hypothetical protein